MSLSRLFRRGLSCHQVLEVLQSYIDGETDAETARKVAAHLDGCGICDHESEVYEKIKASLASRRRPVDPDVMSSLSLFGQRLASGELNPDQL